MSDFDFLISELEKFRDARDWKQFHTSKDLALAIAIEAAELNELFLWKTVEESEKVNRDKLREELADVLAYTFMLAGKHGFDIKKLYLRRSARTMRNTLLTGQKVLPKSIMSCNHAYLPGHF
jgi:NTP pyrophosphatase (non-canonical NTP hydrolase)